MFKLRLPLNITVKQIVAQTAPQDNPFHTLIAKPIETENKAPNKDAPFVILYVEDNASNRALVEAMIKRHSHNHSNIKLYCAKNFKEAKSFLHDLSPNLMMIDLHLPDGSGEDLVIHIKNHPILKNKSIFILSADAMPESIKRLNALGVDAYFTKPLDIALFNQTLQSLLSDFKKP